MIYAIVANVVTPADISRKKRAPLICFSCVKGLAEVIQNGKAVTNMTTSIESKDSSKRSSSDLPVQVLNDSFETHVNQPKSTRRS